MDSGLAFLITGAGGQLGRALLSAAAARGQSAHGAGHAEVPVENAAAVRDWIGRHRPAVVLHCAAWTQVDACERDAARALVVNGTGTANVARACAEVGAALVYVSTDFVFDGDKREPYRIEDEPRPRSAYGLSKLRGEEAVLAAGCPRFWIVRTSWVFGPGGHNFPRSILRQAREGHPLRVVADQVGSPTMTHDLAAALLDLATSPAASGIYHAANEGQCSWYQFAVDIVERAGMRGAGVAPISTAELDRPAERPAYSVLDCSRLRQLRGHALPHYLDALDRYLAEEIG